MTSAEFAALEARLAPVLQGGWSWEYRREVEALLAECRALRAFAPAALATLEQVSWVFETLDNLRAEAGTDGRLATKLRHHLATARGHLLAALGARPPGAEADHDAGDRQLDKVLRDGAELERLRLPPDAAALLTAAERGEMLRRVERDLPQSGHAGGQCLQLLRHAEAQDALVRELYAVVADLHADDPGRQALLGRGRAEGREEAAVLLGGLGDVEAAGKVRALLSPSRPPLPPSEAERGAERLREALRQCLDRLGRMSGTYGTSSATAGAIDAAREALGEGCPFPPSEAEREAARLREALRGLAGTAEAASDVLLDANALGWGAELRGAAAAARKALGEAP